MSNQVIVNSIKSDVLRRWKEKQEKVETFEESYNKMVREAVITIEDGWQRSSLVAANNIPTDFIEVEVIKAFTISDAALRLFCTKYLVPNNPETKKSCFYDRFQFPDSDMVGKYINDVLTHLPEGTVMSKSTSHDPLLGKCTDYSFSLKIDMI